MKIAIVAPSPIPYTVGGMEKLVWDMTSKINGLTSHHAELIKLPVKEDDFWSIIASYHDFWELDLSHFDLVISTKYPSWMVPHPHQICYMVHKLRGLYDTYSLTGLPLEVDSACPHTIALLKFIEDTRYKPDIDAFWHAFDEFERHKKEIPRKDLSFPGPLIRKIVHYLDDYALDPSRIKRYSTMSKTVRFREGYFPDNVGVDVINPPPSNNMVEDVTYGDYFFTVSRLDRAKRVKLLVEAMKHVNGDARLIIAGTGPEEADIYKMAKGDARIELKGRCSDEEVSKLYAGCLAVPYVPYEEDYGLVTIEAFLRRKPVITCLDSGGTTEFVTDGESGIVVSPDARSLAKAMEQLSNDHEQAKKMGMNGFNRIQGLTWDHFLGALLHDNDIKSESSTPRKMVLVLSTYPIYPPRGGGQARTYGIYRYLARYFDVDILSFTSADQPPFRAMIAKGLKETRFPESKQHFEEEIKISRSVGIPVTDVAMPKLSCLTPEFGADLRDKAMNADVIVLSHPYLYDELARVQTRAKIVYDAHDIEYDLKLKFLSKSAPDLLKDVYRVEKACCDRSELIMSCSKNDAIRLQELFNISNDKIIIAPNGVDANSIRFTSRAEREFNKAKAGLSNETIALFMGSWHPPNLDACREIFKMAKNLPDVKFLLMGSQCQAFQNEHLPRNVGLLDVLDDEEKDYLFSIVDIALNPMRSGSGTNLKMFDYMAAGIPVISTRFGARGIENAEEYVYLADSAEEMEKAIRVEADNCDGSKQLKARAIIESEYDWGEISKVLINRLV